MLNLVEDASDCDIAVLDPLLGAIVTLKDGDPGDLDPGGIIKIVAAVKGVSVAATAVTTAVSAAVTVGVTEAVEDPPPPGPPGNTNCGADNTECSGNVGCDGNTKCTDNSKCYGNQQCNDNSSCTDQVACPPKDAAALDEVDEAGGTNWW
jgi:hypothetical protein